MFGYINTENLFLCLIAQVTNYENDSVFSKPVNYTIMRRHKLHNNVYIDVFTGTVLENNRYGYPALGGCYVRETRPFVLPKKYVQKSVLFEQLELANNKLNSENTQRKGR